MAPSNVLALGLVACRLAVGLSASVQSETCTGDQATCQAKASRLAVGDHLLIQRGRLHVQHSINATGEQAPACDPELVTRRRRDEAMCSCRRRMGASNGWRCDGNDMVMDEVATTPSCDESRVARRRRQDEMCSCRRRATVEDGWGCENDQVVEIMPTPAPPTVAPSPTPAPTCDASQISRRRREVDMCSCRRRSGAEKGIACKGDQIVGLPPPLVKGLCDPDLVSRRRETGENMCSCRRRAGKQGPFTCLDNEIVVAAPPEPYVNLYESINPLKIQPAAKREDNYFMIIGDWGKAGGPGSCQIQVANLMKKYAAEQKAAGKKLLAVLSVGDNFYWAGATPTSWATSWEPVYGTNDPDSPLYGVPWLSTLGNHDLGDADPYAYCPHMSPLATFGDQQYGCQQFNSDRNPTRPAGTELYWLPDYSYHYEIPELSVEFIFVDTNQPYVGNKLYSAGFHTSRELCGGYDEVVEFLGRVKDSGTELLRRRGIEGKANTTVILQHYPEHGESTRRVFEKAMNDTHRRSKVLGAWGHDHDQLCRGTDDAGNCDMVLTGGGGGCCMGRFGGFTAVHLTADGGFTTDIESSRVRLPEGVCRV